VDLGFEEDIREVFGHFKAQRQTLLFSATLSEAVTTLASMSLVNPAHLSADKKQSTPTKLTEVRLALPPPTPLHPKVALRTV
jgi:superfamily II DNA/RNA helicase